MAHLYTSLIQPSNSSGTNNKLQLYSNHVARYIPGDQPQIAPNWITLFWLSSHLPLAAFMLTYPPPKYLPLQCRAFKAIFQNEFWLVTFPLSPKDNICFCKQAGFPCLLSLSELCNWSWSPVILCFQVYLAKCVVLSQSLLLAHKWLRILEPVKASFHLLRP